MLDDRQNGKDNQGVGKPASEVGRYYHEGSGQYLIAQSEAAADAFKRMGYVYTPDAKQNNVNKENK